MMVQIYLNANVPDKAGLVWGLEAKAKKPRNRSRFTVIGSRLKKQKVEENYGVLF